MMQNPKFGDATAQNKRSGTARVKENKDEFVMRWVLQSDTRRRERWRGRRKG